MSAATVAAEADPSPSTRTPTREPWPARLVSVGSVVLLVTILGVRADAVATSTVRLWPELVFWTVLLAAVNLFPISVGEMQLVMDIPILVCVAILYPPEVASLVVIVGQIDTRELKRELSLSRALFNRAQVGLIVLVAGLVFRESAGALDPWYVGVPGAGLALLALYAVNVALVAVHSAARTKLTFRQILQRMRVGKPIEFLVSYLGYGFLAIVLAHLYRSVGAWAVVTFLVPTLLARQALLRAQSLQLLTEELRNRERLLERMLDQIVEERRDERFRIAGDLHDDVQQVLTEILMFSRLARRDNEVGKQVSADLDALVVASERSIEALRQVIHDLRESPLARGGLLPTLDGLIRQLRLDSRMRIESDLPNQANVESELQVVVYQVAREALMNAVKHSKASVIRLVLREADDCLSLVVEDDGSGFEPSAVDASSHFGMGLMQERAKGVGGRITLQVDPGQGTSVHAEFPLGGLLIAEGDDESTSERTILPGDVDLRRARTL